MSRLGLLRVTFLALGALLLLPLYVLKGAIDARIAGQARLRHEVVAERIFDEFERELTRVVERETARPSSAYDSPTDPGSWAPFVVGYYVVNHQGARFTAGDESGVGNRALIAARLSAMQSAPPMVPRGSESRDDADQESVKSKAAPTAKTLPSRSSPEVLRKLNVGSQQRKPSASKSKSMSSDPLRDYAF